jgi:hypothetical protein
MLQLHPSLVSSNLLYVSRSEEGPDIVSSVRIGRSKSYNDKEAQLSAALGASGAENAILRQSLEFDVSLDQGSLEEIHDSLASAEIKGCVLRHFLPLRLSVRIESIEEQARALVNYFLTGSTRSLRAGQFSEQDLVIPKAILSLLRQHLGPGFPFSMSSEIQRDAGPGSPHSEEVTLRDWIEATRNMRPIERYRLQQRLQSIPGLSDRILEAASQERGKEFVIRSLVPPAEIMDAASYLDFFFTNLISYLGPLRDEPKALYPLPTSPDLTYVGLRGEYTAAVLDLHKYRYVDYIPSGHFAEPAVKQGIASAPLQHAVSDWLQYLGVAETVQTYDKGKLGHELQVKTPGVPKAHDLTHAGVGLSQVLPILVSCLLSAPDTALLLEQPELHLHPSVQSRLGDFFLSMGLLGKQCIIETHSEYLINRVRFRVASAPKGTPLSSFIKIYFVEKKADTSTFREVLVNEYGAIPDWPEGFFDQSQDEAEQILRAASLKRQNSRAPS